MAQSGRTPTRGGIETRRRIAAQCDTTPRTAAELASALGRPDGGIRTVLRAMVEDGHLRQEARHDARGRAWKLTPSGRREFVVPQTHPAPGVVTNGMRLVLVGDRTTGFPLEALREATRLPGLAWAASLHGGARFVLALDSDKDADRLRLAMSAEGAETVVSFVSELFDGIALSRYLDEVAGVRVRALKSGTTESPRGAA